ncbi:hypothetical protein B9G98_03113 [Wickerhamiella sorbophila]|uniref:Uncharacterized protein n=1 Tax=Wickerhamiella sorbophila TaxID=45607 RepID=A0A2T0FKH6_9ASCO|nr:hypothetical protein B9G98_03113 [Wickerhamiella sorbophila]PRT55493.1 hypothetical protein B9G98_03113 [Wickerhamiella sorbophila]
MPGADEVTQGPADELEAPEPLAIVELDCAPELEAPEPVAVTEPDCAAELEAPDWLGVAEPDCAPELEAPDWLGVAEPDCAPELEAPDWLGVAEPDSRLSWARGVHSVRWARSNRSQSDGTTRARFQQRDGDRRGKRGPNLVDTVDKLVDVVDISTVVAATRLGENGSNRTNDAVQATDKTRKNQFEDGSQDTATVSELLGNILNNSDQVINNLKDRQECIASETGDATKGSKQSLDSAGNCSKQRAKRGNIAGGVLTAEANAAEKLLATLAAEETSAQAISLGNPANSWASILDAGLASEVMSPTTMPPTLFAENAFALALRLSIRVAISATRVFNELM